MGITRTFCRNIVACKAGALDSATIDAARRLILDGIAVAVAGSRERAPTILAEHVRELGCTGRSTAIGFGFKTSPAHAAYVNGVSMHVLDYEAMWSPPNHATSTTLPSVLALAEALGADGREALTALVKGCEVQGRLRLASGQIEPRDLVFHPPGVVGVMSSAAAAAHLLGLDAGALSHAMGLAASRAGTLIANAGTMAKSTHCGMAAALGLDAAQLAARGFTANPNIIEARDGYAQAFFGNTFDPTALEEFGPLFRIVDPGYAIKMFPSQYATHFAIEAAISLHRQIRDSAAIRAVEVRAPVMPYVDRPEPRDGLDGKFSFQYTTASALLDGTVGISTFSDAHRFRSDVCELLPKVRVVQLSEIPGRLDRMHIEVAVTLADGQLLAARCDAPRGSWQKPISNAEHLVKVRECLAAGLGTSEIEECIEAIAGFETLDAAALGALMHKLSGDRVHAMRG
jgi:2-methylcitrate dehydratase PrpD